MITIDTLGLPEIVKDLAMRPRGLFLVTGPTGSGKSTTLAAIIDYINTNRRANIITIEDPIEFVHEPQQCLFNQRQVHVHTESFANALRAALREDPDIVLVGEIRDGETAEIAIKAALTGHLVLSTLHTNDAPTANTRLLDMGVEPFLISASLELVVAQRLVRRICPKCVEPYEPSEDELVLLGLSPHEVGDKKFYKGRGCEDCNDTGYKGRKGIYETLRINDTLREMINQRAPGVVLRQKAIELGMRTLREEGLQAIFDGETSVEEILKYT